MPTRTVQTYCRNCGALCPLTLTVEEDGRIVSIAPDGSKSPYGTYACPKGLASMDFHNDRDGRLMGSFKRREGGGFDPIPVETALDEIAARLKALLDEYGPRSIAFYHGTGAYRSTLGGLLERAMCAELGTPNFFSSMTIDQSAKWVTAGRMGVMASGKPRLDDVDLAVLVGNNPVVSHQTFPFSAGQSGGPARGYTDFKARGGRLIVVDPRRNETARFADLLIQPLPGHDAAIFAAIAHILLRDGTYDHAFCERFVEPLEAVRAAVARWTPEVAAERADVPAEQIEQAAAWIGAARRPFVGSGSGPSMASRSNLADHMIETVNALVGGYRRAGDVVRNPGTLKPKRVKAMAVPPTRSWERGPKCRTVDIGAIYGEFPTALLPREIATPGPDRIRALIVLGGNPLQAVGDPTRAIAGFDALDILVSIDARMNETGRLSDYVIGSTQYYERHDLSVAGDAQYPTAFAQYAAPVVPKPEGLIDDWEFYWGVASRMGLPLTLRYWTYGLQYGSIKRAMPLDMETPPDPEAMFAFLCEDGVVPFETLKRHPGGIVPERPPQHVEPAEDDGGRLVLCPGDVAAELDAMAADAPEPGYAYRLVTRRLLEVMNGAYRESGRARRKFPVNWAYMNPADMAAEGLADGDAIDMVSPDGRIVAIAKAEDRLRRGVVSMSHLFGTLAPSVDPWAEGGSNAGHLTSLDRWLEPINFMPRFSGIPIRINRRAAEPAASAA